MLMSFPIYIDYIVITSSSSFCCNKITIIVPIYTLIRTHRFIHRLRDKSQQHSIGENVCSPVITPTIYLQSQLKMSRILIQFSARINCKLRSTKIMGIYQFSYIQMCIYSSNTQNKHNQ